MTLMYRKCNINFYPKIERGTQHAVFYKKKSGIIGNWKKLVNWWQKDVNKFDQSYDGGSS